LEKVCCDVADLLHLNGFHESSVADALVKVCCLLADLLHPVFSGLIHLRLFPPGPIEGLFWIKRGISAPERVVEGLFWLKKVVSAPE